MNRIVIKKELIDKKNNILIDRNKELEEKDKLIDEKNKISDEKNKLIDQKKIQLKDEEIKYLRNEIQKLMLKQNINITNNITNNKTINNNLTININSFGEEDLSHITNKDYRKFLNSYFPGLINYIEKVHFDENKPENHNICITNLRSKHIFIHDKGKWLTKKKNDIIDRFIAKKYDMLTEKCCELEELNEIDVKILNNFEQFSENYKNSEAQKNNRDDIILMIYNNKDKINLKNNEILQEVLEE